MKKWDKPQLIVLAQGTPEESVLTHCKINNPNNPSYEDLGPNAAFNQSCTDTLDSCANCQSRARGT